MLYETYSHRFADIILNSDYEIKKEIDAIDHGLDFTGVCKKFDEDNMEKKQKAKKTAAAKAAASEPAAPAPA